MKPVKFISVIGLFLSRILSVAYLATALYILCSVVFRLSTLQLLAHNRFAICYPFTAKPFLLGSDFSTAYILEMVLLIAFYGIFFWLLSNVFKTFRQKKLFTTQGIQRLKAFYITNLLICPVIFLILSIYSIEDYPYIAMIMAHGIMGIFALFIAAIFEQGVHLQKDQDLFI